MPAPEIVRQLVERFDFNEDALHSPHYNEAQLRQEFLNPFFKALGWDVYNEKDYALQYREVIHEDSIHIKGSPNAKAPDYAFRLGGVRKFFVEAKKPAEDIQNTKEFAYQLKIYAWNTGLPLSILTDFEEFAVYDCRSKPNLSDSPATGRVLYIKYEEYLERWDEIAGIFSPDAIRKGAFDKYAEDNTAKKGTISVDDAFLEEIETWRTLLARNIALRNQQVLNERQLNYAVQMTIDRIIFLRICEDRGIEPQNQLLELLNRDDIYQQLVVLYHRADLKYNSGLFHFKTDDSNTNNVDTFTPSLTIDDKVLKDIIKSLYYPCPYVFKEIPVEILGQVYEQFLGKVIRLTPSHRAKIEEKPEVRKAGGVYYTPKYIVDYIVENTVGKLLAGKSASDAEKLKIVDPACGSGSFLLGAFQYLMNWHEDWYLANDPEKWTRGRDPALIQTADGDWRLTTDKKKRILVNNIHGVDIDQQAVEVTKLSLLLKVLEEETGQLTLGFERALPDLNENVKCGNSLINWDYFAEQLLPDQSEVQRINPFDWEKQFPEVFSRGGFDAVIGNPPYVRQESLGEDKKYYKAQYEVYTGTADLYSYFIEKGIKLLNKGGMFSYIVANKWLRARYGKPLRDWLKTQCLEEITDFDDLPVFEDATTYPCILRVSNQEPHMKPWVTNVEHLEFDSLVDYVTNYGYHVDQSKFEEEGWSLSDPKTLDILNKIHIRSLKLEEYINEKMYRGIVTGLNRVFIIDKKIRDQLITDDKNNREIIKPLLIGKDLNRYSYSFENRYIIFTRRGIDIDQYPIIKDYLDQYKEKLMPRPNNWDGPRWKGRKPGPYKWYEIQDTVAYYKEFEKPKITWGNLSVKPKFCIDYDAYYINAPSVIISKDDLYLLGILNSNLCYFYISKIAASRRGGFFEYKPIYVSKIPIHIIDQDNPDEIEKHHHIINLVKHMLGLQKRSPQTPYEQERLQREIDATDAQIDRMVYELYGLTEEEIKIVEGESKE